jgi:hypothetical protein
LRRLRQRLIALVTGDTLGKKFASQRGDRLVLGCGDGCELLVEGR